MHKVGFALLNALLVFIGGGLGALCRFEIGHLLPESITAQPIFNATLLVNMSACLLAGMITGLLYGKTSRHVELLRAFAMFGFFGGFSTLAALEVVTIAVPSANIISFLVITISHMFATNPLMAIELIFQGIITNPFTALIINIIGGIVLAVVGFRFALRKRGVEW